MDQNPAAIGIDFGSAFSRMAYCPDPSPNPQMVPNRGGHPWTPSVVYFGDSGPTVGAAARTMLEAGNLNVAAWFKRHLGDPQWRLPVAGRDWTAVELSALVFGSLRRDAETFLSQPIESVVVGVPGSYRQAEREATIEACRLAGLQVQHVIPEPVAVLLNYHMYGGAQEERVVVYDLGAGSFDVTVLGGRLTAATRRRSFRPSRPGP